MVSFNILRIRERLIYELDNYNFFTIKEMKGLYSSLFIEEDIDKCISEMVDSGIIRIKGDKCIKKVSDRSIFG